MEDDPIYAKQTYLTHAMQDELETVEVFTFEIFQKPEEAIFISAGCLHQVQPGTILFSQTVY